ncbi:hypothetical protein FEDK69T_29910 [Flavobacterium enshiense DK69]|nr:hypothetical protein FEDK69T_29910 [Flavobacterium enshiense DK69]
MSLPSGLREETFELFGNVLDGLALTVCNNISQSAYKYQDIQ